MSNKSVNNSLFTQVVKSVAGFWSNLFVSSSTREFNRLKNFIAS